MKTPRREAGFSVVLMLAVIVLVGGMLAYTVSLGSTMHAAAAQAIGTARAAQAAQAGLEWSKFRIRIGAAPLCTAVTNLTLPMASGAMPVTVRCTLSGTHTEGVATVRTYQLSANACLPAGAGGVCPNAAGGGDYVERAVVGSAER